MIGITMRRMRWTYKSGKTEIRDGLDTEWWKFLSLCLPQAACVPLPNAIPLIRSLLIKLPFTGFILTGGDDWGVFPERDTTETFICEYANKQGLPVLGVCRGAQLLSRILGASILNVEGHVATRHEIFYRSRKSRIVNSFHEHGISSPGAYMNVIATDSIGHVEAFASTNGLIQGIMWHPEREKQPDERDKKLIIQMFSSANKN